MDFGYSINVLFCYFSFPYGIYRAYNHLKQLIPIHQWKTLRGVASTGPELYLILACPGQADDLFTLVRLQKLAIEASSGMQCDAGYRPVIDCT